TAPRSRATRPVEYPTGDGKPMAETDLHRQDMVDLIETLQDHFAGDLQVYVTGNLLLYYEEGNPRKHVSPDVFVVRGVPKLPPRDYYLLWKERKAPEVVIEITSKTTRREDQNTKLALYRDILQVPEYFQFDPTEDYLKPSLQGHRLVDGDYQPIPLVHGRLPSKILGLYLERDGTALRLYNPAPAARLLTREEALAASDQQLALTTQQLALRDAENERLRRELEALRRTLPPAAGDPSGSCGTSS
ncbi:MAG: Uma2 family endonuclease, partial [Isosphaeraceae bacterium]